jgi:hypothetical protein
MILDPSTYERDGTVPHQDICGIIPPQAGLLKGARGTIVKTIPRQSSADQT